MRLIPDEIQLTAYALGELGPEGARTVAAYLAEHPHAHAAHRLVAEMRSTATLLADGLQVELAAQPLQLDPARRQEIIARAATTPALQTRAEAAPPPGQNQLLRDARSSVRDAYGPTPVYHVLTRRLILPHPMLRRLAAVAAVVLLLAGMVVAVVRWHARNSGAGRDLAQGTASPSGLPLVTNPTDPRLADDSPVFPIDLSHVPPPGLDAAVANVPLDSDLLDPLPPARVQVWAPSRPVESAPVPLLGFGQQEFAATQSIATGGGRGLQAQMARYHAHRPGQSPPAPPQPLWAQQNHPVSLPGPDEFFAADPISSNRPHLPHRPGPTATFSPIPPDEQPISVIMTLDQALLNHPLHFRDALTDATTLRRDPAAQPSADRREPFVRTADQPHATFGLDVFPSDELPASNPTTLPAAAAQKDSFAAIDRALSLSLWPARQQVRIEQMINAFTYDYPACAGDAPLAARGEVAQCPWNPQHRLLRLVIKARQTPVSPPADATDLPLVARDVKIAVDFNSEAALSYRLLGYQDRPQPATRPADQAVGPDLLADAAVVALYEVIPAPRADAGHVTLATLTIHYQYPPGGTTEGMNGDLSLPIADATTPILATTPDFQFTSAVAGFGLLLRNSPNKGTATWQAILDWATPATHQDATGARTAFLALVRQAQSMDHTHSENANGNRR